MTRVREPCTYSVEGADEGGAVGRLVQPADDAAVELEVLGPHQRELTEPGVAGADVVDREGDARARAAGRSPPPPAPRRARPGAR